jgi:hypothetical protein
MQLDRLQRALGSDAKRSSGAALSSSEWDFRSLLHKCPNEIQRHELRVAIFYEYARESSTIREIAHQFSKLPSALRREFGLRQCSKHPRITRKLFFISSLPFSHCVFWPTFFPRTPWLKIPPSERRAAVEQYVRRMTATLFEIKSYDEIREWEVSDKETRRFTSSGIEHLAVAIDWTVGSNDQIIAAFASWIRNNRPEALPSPRSDASRENVAAAFLTRIAVMRLLHKYSHYEALGLAQSHGLKMPKQQSNALTARRRVAHNLPWLFQSQAFQANTGHPLIPSAERPRSWRTVTEQQRMRPT